VDPTRVAYQRSHTDLSPTRLRVIVGVRLRRLREAANLTTDEAAVAIRGSHSKISRLERGKQPFKPRDLNDLLTLYGVSDSAELLALAEQANHQSWWSDYGDAVPPGLETYLGFEQAASLIRCYDALSVPVLLQSRDYARTLIELTDAALTSWDVSRRVELRMRRQQALLGEDPVRLWAILDEAVLHRSFGGDETMRGQLRHLIDIASLPNVTIQVLRFGACGYTADGSFAVLRFRENEIPDTVFAEHVAGTCHYDKPADVNRYWDAVNRLTVLAEQPDVTLSILEQGLQ
jgi:transcriptional regulator with XRE-family HTH domain